MSILFAPDVLKARGYRRIDPKGVICKCPGVEQDTEGYWWCCLNIPSATVSGYTLPIAEVLPPGGGVSTQAEVNINATHLDERGVVRQDRYGPSRQPWDDAVDEGWAPEAAALNILKYLRRDKEPAHSLESARWYYARLRELSRGELFPAGASDDVRRDLRVRAGNVRQRLYELLTDAERDLLG
jgi:hypothetical protein